MKSAPDFMTFGLHTRNCHGHANNRCRIFEHLTLIEPRRPPPGLKTEAEP